MKIINSPQVLITIEDLEKLLVRFVEKKTGKKVESVEFPKPMTGDSMRGAAIVVKLPDEVNDMEEVKNG